VHTRPVATRCWWGHTPILPSQRAPARPVTATIRRVPRGATAALSAHRRPAAPPPIRVGGWPHRRLGLGTPPPLPSAGAAAEPRRGCGLQLGVVGVPTWSSGGGPLPPPTGLSPTSTGGVSSGYGVVFLCLLSSLLGVFSCSCLDRRSSADPPTPHHHPRQPLPSWRARVPSSGGPTAGVASLQWPSLSRPPPTLSAPSWHPLRPPTLGPASPTACRT